MKNKNPLTFTFRIIAILLGVILFKQFDFKTLTFEKPILAGVYFIIFLFSIFFLIKNANKRVEK